MRCIDFPLLKFIWAGVSAREKKGGLVFVVEGESGSRIFWRFTERIPACAFAAALHDRIRNVLSFFIHPMFQSPYIPLSLSPSSSYSVPRLHTVYPLSRGEISNINGRARHCRERARLATEATAAATIDRLPATQSHIFEKMSESTSPTLVIFQESVYKNKFLSFMSQLKASMSQVSTIKWVIPWRASTIAEQRRCSRPEMIARTRGPHPAISYE